MRTFPFLTRCVCVCGGGVMPQTVFSPAQKRCKLINKWMNIFEIFHCSSTLEALPIPVREWPALDWSAQRGRWKNAKLNYHLLFIFQIDYVLHSVILAGVLKRRHCGERFQYCVFNLKTRAAAEVCFRIVKEEHPQHYTSRSIYSYYCTQPV